MRSSGVSSAGVSGQSSLLEVGTSEVLGILCSGVSVWLLANSGTLEMEFLGISRDVPDLSSWEGITP